MRRARLALSIIVNLFPYLAPPKEGWKDLWLTYNLWVPCFFFYLPYINKSTLLLLFIEVGRGAPIYYLSPYK